MNCSHVLPARCSSSPQVLRTEAKVQSALRWGECLGFAHSLSLIAGVSILITVNLPQKYSHFFSSCPLTPSFSCENVLGPPCSEPLVSSYNWGFFTCRPGPAIPGPALHLGARHQHSPGSDHHLAECFGMEKVKP